MKMRFLGNSSKNADVAA
ncbi:hypothetical protein C5167_029589 [Papaver somniferum]|nr:hypothetical protein C5167_029589 [Papaver somniferum]